jgi:hypothetical protein
MRIKSLSGSPKGVQVMQVRQFVEKRVNIDNIKMLAAERCFSNAGDYDDTEFAVAVIMLKEFEREMTDRFWIYRLLQCQSPPMLIESRP